MISYIAATFYIQRESLQTSDGFIKRRSKIPETKSAITGWMQLQISMDGLGSCWWCGKKKGKLAEVLRDDVNK